MCKRILTQTGYNTAVRHDAYGDEGTNLDLIREYGHIIEGMYAVIIADDNRFEGL